MDEKRKELAKGFIRDALVACATLSNFREYLEEIIEETRVFMKDRTGEDMDLSEMKEIDQLLSPAVIGKMSDAITQEDLKKIQANITEIMQKAIVMTDPKTHEPVGDKFEYDEVSKRYTLG